MRTVLDGMGQQLRFAECSECKVLLWKSGEIQGKVWEAVGFQAFPTLAQNLHLSQWESLVLNELCLIYKLGI